MSTVTREKTVGGRAVTKLGYIPMGQQNTNRCMAVHTPRQKTKLFSAIAEKGLSSKQTKERTFSEILQLWLCNNRLRQKGATEHKYRTIIDKHIEPEIGSLKLSKISAVTINSLLERKLKFGRIDKSGGLSPSYVRTMASIIQSALQFAVDEGYCQPLKSTVCKPPLEKRIYGSLRKTNKSNWKLFFTVALIWLA